MTSCNAVQTPSSKVLPAQITLEVKTADETVGYLQLRVGFKGCKDFDLGHCYKEKVDPKYNLLLTRQYKHTQEGSVLFCLRLV